MSATMLDEAYEHIASQRVREGMDVLFNGLGDLRRSMDRQEWMSWAQNAALSHPLCSYIHSDPFTYRSFSKPRGYAGDGVLIDMVYKYNGAHMHGTTPLGKQIYEITSNAPAAKAVRNRRAHIARLIDSVARGKHNAAVMAIACGHLRECEWSSAVQNRALSTYVAVDQDPRNLAVIQRDYAELGITVRQASLRDILSGNLNGVRFDLIYTAGLYDYLPNTVAKKLTSVLFGMLSHGGVLFAANFLPQIRDAAYMESYMAWSLIYRTENQMIELLVDVEPDQLDSVDVVNEAEQNIAFMTLVRRELDIAW